MTSPHCPAEWSLHRLSDLVTIKHGFAFKGEHFGPTGPYALVTPGNFWETGGFKHQGDKQKRYDGPIPDNYVLRTGDLVVAMTEQAEGLLGSAALIPPGDTYLHNQRIGLVCSDKLDRRFLYFLFNHRSVRQQIRATSSGAKVRHTSPSRIGEVVVAVPPKPIQERIADILFSYEDLIAVNRRRISILQEMADSIFDEWFDKRRHPAFADDVLVETSLGLLPSRWEVQTASRVLSYMGGGTPSKSEASYWDGGTIEWFTPTDLTRRGDTFAEKSGLRITDRGLKESSARLFPAYSVMMTSRATLGVFAINTSPACTNQGFITFVPSPRLPLYFLYHLLRHAFPRMEAISSGATFREITKGALGGLDFAIPPSEQVLEFEDRVAPMMRLVLNLGRQNERLRKSRDMLSARLISGVVEVADASTESLEAA